MIYFRTVPQTNVLGRVNKSYQGLLPQIHCQLSKWWKQFSMRLGRCKKTVGRTDPIHVAMPRWSTCCFFSLWSACGTKWHFPTFCFLWMSQCLAKVFSVHGPIIMLSFGLSGEKGGAEVQQDACTKSGWEQHAQKGYTKLADWLHFGKRCPTSRKSALRCLLLPSRAAPLENVTDPWLERKWRKMRDWHSAANGTRRIIWVGQKLRNMRNRAA